MKTELKSIKVMASLSEETHCYTARLYYDGKPVADVSNHGHGGCDDQHVTDREGFAKAQDEITALPPHRSFGTSLDMDVELWCALQVDKHLLRADLRRLMSKHVVFSKKGETDLRQLAFKGRPKIGPQHCAIVRQKVEDVDVVLNEMPLDEALAIFSNVVGGS